MQLAQRFEFDRGGVRNLAVVRQAIRWTTVSEVSRNEVEAPFTYGEESSSNGHSQAQTRTDVRHRMSWIVCQISASPCGHCLALFAATGAHI